MAKSSISGFDDAMASFAALEKAAQNRALRSAINAGLNPILKATRQSAPKGSAPHKTYKGRVVAPGFLSQSITKSTRIGRNKKFVFGTVRPKSEAWYGSLLEHGWRPGGRKGRSKAIKSASRRSKGGLSAAQLSKLGDTRRKIPGNKWWSRAIERAEPEVDAVVQEKLFDRIYREWRRAA